MNDRAPASTRELLDFATEIAWEAGRLIMRHFQVGVGVTTKPDRTPVTEADIAGERLLRKRIEARFPGHRILGEEDGESGSDPNHRWILDPIDGTTSFIHGVPLFGMLIGLEIGDEAVVGVCNIAGLGEMVTGARGEGAFWNGRPARVSSVTEIGNALATTTDPATIGPIWDAVGAKGAVRRTWGDAFGHALVCTGRSEIGLDPEMKAWDSSPFLPILEEAGRPFHRLGREPHDPRPERAEHQRRPPRRSAGPPGGSPREVEGTAGLQAGFARPGGRSARRYSGTGVSLPPRLGRCGDPEHRLGHRRSWIIGGL